MTQGGILARTRAARRVAAVAVAVALALSTLVVLRAPAASAADGTVLRTITADVPTCSVSTGLAFDGSRLLLSCNYNNQIYAVSPTDGARLATYTISGLGAIGALAWDRGRGKLWACEGFGGDDHRLWLIDLATSTATLQFRTQGCVDGLAYDGADDTIWSSADVASSVQHYKTDGTLIASPSVSGKLGNCGSSGIAVGGPSLFLANNGCEQIYKAPKTLDSTSLFGTYPARLEDLECDDITFGGSGKAAIWSKDAYDNVLNAFELNPGDCGYGGFASTITLSPLTDQGPVGSSHPVTARVNDPTSGEPLSGAFVSFSVVSGPNAGASGDCFHNDFFDFPRDVSCNTDSDGEVSWSYRGSAGIGHDTIEARVSVPSDSTFPGTQEVVTTAGMDWRDPARYVALGDSYSAGEGLSPYGFPPPGRTQPNRCHRSATQAYPEHLRPSFYTSSIFDESDDGVIEATFDFIACSGATTRNVRRNGLKQYNEPGPQLAQSVVDLDTNLTTITIGGNDVGFSEVLRKCALHACTSDSYKFKDGVALTEWLPAKIDSLKPILRTTFEQTIEEVGTRTTIVALGYPHLFPASDEEQTCFKLHPWLGEQDYLRQMTARFNNVLASAAAEAGVHFVPVADAFAGHEPCGNEGEWINAATTHGFSFSAGPSSFHPKSSGQQAYADVLEAWLDDEIASGAPILSNGFPANPEPAAAFAAETLVTGSSIESSLGTTGRLVIDPVPGSVGPCSGDLHLYSPGQQLHLSGSEFAPGAEVSVTYGLEDATVRTAITQITADSVGDIDTVVSLPAELPVDSHADLQAIGPDVEAGSRMLLELITLEAPTSNCDVSAPAIDIISPVGGATYTLGEAVAADFSCDDGTGGSGVVSCEGTFPDGAPVDTSTAGDHTFSVVSVDAAGNRGTETVTYTVGYAFTGFMTPIENTPVVNVINAGRAVPVKWAITDASGAGIGDPSSIVSITSVQTECETGAPQNSADAAATTSGLHYLGEGRWIYNWRTASSYSGTCRTLQLELADGSEHEAVFRFR